MDKTRSLADFIDNLHTRIKEKEAHVDSMHAKYEQLVSLTSA